jgi:hypothetical protein
VTVYNGKLNISFDKGALLLSSERLWHIDLKPGKTKDSVIIHIPDDGLYQVHVDEYIFGGMYYINWELASGE